MTIQVKHKFVSAKVDTLDNSKVQPSNWNDTHDILLAGGVVVGRAAGGGQAAAQELPMGVTGQAVLAAANQAAAQAAIGADGTQAAILAAAGKATPVDADAIGILDSAAGNALKKTTWAQLKAALKTYFDTLYVAVGAAISFTTNLVSTTANVILATTGAGVIYFRPNGVGSATGQVYIDSAGNLIVAGKVYQNAGVMMLNGPTVVLEDQQPSGTAPQGIGTNAWITKTLNTKVRDPLGVVTLAANTFISTVPGWVEWEVPSYAGEFGKSRLYNVTDAVSAGIGMTTRSNGGGEQHIVTMTGGAPVIAGKTYRLEVFSQAGQAGSSFNTPGVVEVYARVRFFKD